MNAFLLCPPKKQTQLRPSSFQPSFCWGCLLVALRKYWEMASKMVLVTLPKEKHILNDLARRWSTFTWACNIVTMICPEICGRRYCSHMFVYKYIYISHIYVYMYYFLLQYQYTVQKLACFNSERYFLGNDFFK